MVWSEAYFVWVRPHSRVIGSTIQPLQWLMGSGLSLQSATRRVLFYIFIYHKCVAGFPLYPSHEECLGF
jgi:hypothetical protein